MYQSAALLPTEPDGHELEESGGRTLTGCYVSLRPSYQRREEQALGDGEVWTIGDTKSFSQMHEIMFQEESW